MNQLPITEEFLQQVELLQILIKNNVAGMFGGNHRTRTFGSSCDFADYRDYMAGDDIKKIDWYAYARSEKLYLKQYMDERQMHTRIYIDASRSMRYGGGKKDVQAVRLAATLAYLSICDMDKVSIYVVRDAVAEEIISSMLGKGTFYEQIAKLNDIVFDGDSYISRALLPSKVGYGDGLSVIISDFLTDNDFEDAIDFLTAKKRDILCMQVLSAEELKPKVRGKQHFFDSENLARSYRKNINRDIIAAYRRALEYATNRISSFCRSRGGEYMLVSAEESMGSVFFDRLAELGVVK